MKKIVTVTEVEGEGLKALLGKKVLLMCANYFYSGELVGVNDKFVMLKGPSIVYQTGGWMNAKYSDEQKLHVEEWYVRTDMIESYGLSK